LNYALFEFFTSSHCHFQRPIIIKNNNNRNNNNKKEEGSAGGVKGSCTGSETFVAIVEKFCNRQCLINFMHMQRERERD